MSSLRALCVIFILCCSVMRTVTSHEFYDLKPVKLGCEVRGIDIGHPVPMRVIEQIKQDVTEHRILIFKDQHEISPKRHVRISRWFGDLESSFFTQHPKSPLRDIYRASNDKSEGIRPVGNEEFHTDCLYLPKVCSHGIYQMVNGSKEAESAFVPLSEIVEGLTKEQRNRWERLWMVVQQTTRVVHPLIYSHPGSNEKVFFLPTDYTVAFEWDRGNSKTRRLTEPEETSQIRNEIHDVFTEHLKDLQYIHKWEVGDFIISDNQAVAHCASPSSQKPRTEVGLRVLHRVTVAGKEAPEKKYISPSLERKTEL
ncbi:alpha-ketoglutarate-dependent taurine dioxygenase-like [Saccoglossus kowalevskii]|uniref:Uncharacterized protein LOC100378971 n=1 Tax=Saccoglossus kowalevskii TaxID=10224 RepID=A0ABM0GSA5_SACKO|nr:PREDICTED: uncharacterized protein LOC100378971 [Saccoglossus kowalevskii]